MDSKTVKEIWESHAAERRALDRKTILALRTNEILRPFCCDCMEWMLPVFEECFPGDDRLCRLMKLNREYSMGHIPYEQVRQLREEIWGFWQVVDALGSNFRTATKYSFFIVKMIIESALSASANPITQDCVFNLLDNHLWIVRTTRLDEEVDWHKRRKENQVIGSDALRVKAFESVTERIKNWQFKRLMAYFTGTEKTKMEGPPRDFVDVETLFGVEWEFMSADDARQGAEELAAKLGLERKWMI